MVEPRGANRASVLTELLATSPTTRTAIAESTGLSSATVTRVVDTLIDEGIARELRYLPVKGRGRRAVLIEAVSELSIAVGVDLGASNTRLVAIDLLAKELVVSRTTTPSGLDTSSLIEWIKRYVSEQLGTQWAQVGALAIGIPGAVNPRTRHVSNAPNLLQIEGPGFANALEKSLGLPINVDNDANYALLGENRFGAARGVGNSVMFTLGAGLGAGISIEGRLFRGTNGLVGEFGSLPIGLLGSRLEHLVTGPGIMQRASEMGISLSSPAELFTETKNDSVRTLRNQFEEALQVALTAAIVSADPEMIVLGGGIAASLQNSLGRLTQGLKKTLGHSPELRIAELGDLSGALGAAVKAHQRIVSAMGVPLDAMHRLPRR